MNAARIGTTRSTRRARLLLYILAVALTAIATGPQEVLACPSCKQAIASAQDSGGDMVRGFYWSIVLMLSTPLAILGTLGGSIYVSICRHRDKLDTDE